MAQNSAGPRERAYVLKATEMGNWSYPRLLEPTRCHQEPQMLGMELKVWCLPCWISVLWSNLSTSCVPVPPFWSENVRLTPLYTVKKVTWIWFSRSS